MDHRISSCWFSAIVYSALECGCMLTLVLLDRNHANLCVRWFGTGIGMLYCWSTREHTVLLFQHYVKFSETILLWCEKTSTLLFRFPKKRKLLYTNCVFHAGVHKSLEPCLVVTNICMFSMWNLHCVTLLEHSVLNIMHSWLYGLPSN